MRPKEKSHISFYVSGSPRCPMYRRCPVCAVTAATPQKSVSPELFKNVFLNYLSKEEDTAGSAQRVLRCIFKKTQVKRFKRETVTNTESKLIDHM